MRGGQIISKETQLMNPCPDWLPDNVWDQISVLDRLHSFRNIAQSFEQNVKDWKDWFFRPEPVCLSTHQTFTFLGKHTYPRRMGEQIKRTPTPYCC